MAVITFWRRMLAGIVVAVACGAFAIAQERAARTTATILGLCHMPEDRQPRDDILIQVFRTEDVHFDPRTGFGESTPRFGLQLTRGNGNVFHIAKPVLVVTTGGNGVWLVPKVPIRDYVYTAQKVVGSVVYSSANFISGKSMQIGQVDTEVTLRASGGGGASGYEQPQTVWYISTRQPIPSGEAPLSTSPFANNEGDGTLRAGTCTIETHGLHRLHCVADTLAHLQSTMHTPTTQWLIAAHGFNVSFTDAVRVGAQLQAYLHRRTVVYDWPSYANVSSYAGDEEQVQWSQDRAGTTLLSLVRTARPENIAFFAHSMGSRAVVWTLEAAAAARMRGVKGVAFAAGDIDSRTFVGAMPTMAPVAQVWNSYASTHDHALQLSDHIHVKHQRLGEIAGSPVVAAGLVTIDASSADTDWLGHGYYSDRALLADISQAYAGIAPASRAHLSLDTSHQYYVFHH